MADKEFKDFPAVLWASLTGTDILAVQTDVGATRTNKKLTYTELTGGIQGLINATSLTALAGAISLSGAQVSGTLAAARFPALTGDVTTSAGSLATAIGANKVLTTMILDANVTLAKIANVADQTVLGNLSGGAAAPSALTTLPNSVQDNITRLGTIATGVWSGTVIGISKGGTGQATAALGYAALSPLTTKGDVQTYSTTTARLAVGTDGQVLTADSTQATGLKWAAGGSGSPAGATTNVQYNASGAFGAEAAFYYTAASDLLSILSSPGANTAPTAGFEAINTTVASSGNQQYSPATFWDGQGWKTAATAASQSVRFRVYNQTVQGSAAPSGTWTLESSVAGGAFGSALTYTSGGVLTVFSSVTAGGNLTFGTASGAIWSGRSTIKSSADGVLELFNNATNAFTRLNFGGTTSSFPAIARSGTTLIAETADGLTVCGVQLNTPSTAKTADYTLLALDSGAGFSNRGAGGAVILTLPTAVAGQNYYFEVYAAQQLKVLAVGSDTIRYGATVSAAAGNILASAKGCTLHLYCPVAGEWFIDELVGTWTGPT